MASFAFVLQRHRAKPPPHGVILIITQIGRENKFSAEIPVITIYPLRMRRENGSFFCYKFSTTIATQPSRIERIFCRVGFSRKKRKEISEMQMARPPLMQG